VLNRSQKSKGDPLSKLSEKVALITGGSRGIGAAIAKRLATDGATVAITYAKDADAASAVVKEIERNGGKAIAIQANAADVDAVKAAVEKTVAALGRLDVLVNNAGTAIPKTFEETTLEEMDRMIDINLRGTLTATQAALKHMKSGGRIIMIGSCVGERVLTPGHRGDSRHRSCREAFRELRAAWFFARCERRIAGDRKTYLLPHLRWRGGLPGHRV
jgi:NAD(P)-dependent dehydrogenase (short-subunit alcohol dehydrogenase family)